MPNKKKKKYKLVWGRGDFKAFLIELVMKGGYNSLLSIHEKPHSEVYISENDEKKLAKEGIKLYDNKRKVIDLLNKGKISSKKVKEVISEFNKINLQKKTDFELKEILKKFYSCQLKFLRIYCFTEVMYSPEIDKTIRNFIFGKTKNRNNRNYIFSVLVNPSENKGIIQERERFLVNLRAPEKIENLCQSVRKIGKVKIIWRSIFNQSYEFLVNLFKEIARRNYLSLDQVENCLYRELLNLLEKKKVNLDKINQRTKCFVAFKEGDKYNFYIGEKAKQIISKIKFKIPKDIKEFSGDIASIGVAKGRVKIFRSIFAKGGTKEILKKIKEMKKGEILVALATGPEMIMACKKAGAIVAEEGGINSHAAIISRELGIPGIVNTKIATRILEDGDLVEVDANKGVVKILRRTKNRI